MRNLYVTGLVVMAALAAALGPATVVWGNTIVWSD